MEKLIMRLIAFMGLCFVSAVLSGKHHWGERSSTKYRIIKKGGHKIVDEKIEETPPYYVIEEYGYFMFPFKCWQLLGVKMGYVYSDGSGVTPCEYKTPEEAQKTVEHCLLCDERDKKKGKKEIVKIIS